MTSIMRKQFMSLFGRGGGGVGIHTFVVQAKAPAAQERAADVADEHRPRALGIDGDPVATTPNLDAMARSAVRFDNAYCASPVCALSRRSLHTGLYLQRLHPSRCDFQAPARFLPG
jgi:hypothetical protein